MLKNELFLCVLLCIAGNVFANNSVNATIEINGVIINNGSIYVAVYSNEEDYKKEKAFYSFILQPDNTTLIYSLELPEGEYVVSIFQDSNNDGRLNSTIFGIPTEHIGITNYNLRGVPSGFQKLKVPINNYSTRLTVNMGRVKPLGII
jgi:uncharacterized protein (DUF2141 family)